MANRIESVTAGSDDPFAAFVDWYASSEHRDQPAVGCAIAGLAVDVRQERVRLVYSAQLERYLNHLAQLLGGGPDARERATVALSSLVGALLLARVVEDPTLSDEILRAVRTAVKNSSTG